MTAALLAAAVVALLVSGCAAGGSGTDVRTVEVTMTDKLLYDPDEVTVTAGETVGFVVHNTGETVHEFLIGDEAQQAEYAAEMAEGHGAEHGSEAGISVDPGETGEFSYTFGGPGELLIGCHEPGHLRSRHGGLDRGRALTAERSVVDPRPTGVVAPNNAPTDERGPATSDPRSAVRGAL